MSGLARRRTSLCRSAEMRRSNLPQMTGTFAPSKILRMKNINRRDLCVALSAFAAMGSVMAEAQTGAAAGPDGKLSKSVVFSYDQLPVKNNANGGTGRQVLSGTLPTGEFVEVHETTLPAGKMPHPPHRHSHSEFLFIREGHLEYLDEGVP